MKPIAVTGVLTAVIALAGCATPEAEGAGASPSSSSSSAMMAAMSAASPASAPSAGTTQAWSKVASDQVCMVNNQFMGLPQIPVVVEGKTYFGCCEMCKARLAKDPSSRTATDPVSKREVDKAGAVIAKNQQGAVMYFESEASLSTYLKAQP